MIWPFKRRRKLKSLEMVDVRLAKIEENIKFLFDLQEPNCSIEIVTEKEASSYRRSLEKKATETKKRTTPPLQCKMSIVKKGGKKPKAKEPSVPRKIIKYLSRCGVGEYVLAHDVKYNILGGRAVCAGGGHFSRSISRLGDLGLICIEGVQGEVSISLTEKGLKKHELCWFTLKDYHKLESQ